MNPVFPWFAAVIAGGCIARVDLEASIAGAHLTKPNGDVVALPATVRVGLPALRVHEVRVEADGYRPIRIDIGRRTTWGSGFPPRWIVGRTTQVGVRLVPEHAPLGTAAPPAP